MAMAVIVNALVFHAALSEAGMAVPATPPRAVRTPHHFRSQGAFRPTQILDEWGLILRVNYWPIFYTAGAILRGLSSRQSATLLENLWETAETLIVGGATSSHDLTGAVFQRLIADRKFLATFYTRPAAAALLRWVSAATSATLNRLGLVRLRCVKETQDWRFRMRYRNSFINRLSQSCAAS